MPIFAALLGALSSVSSFAAESNNKNLENSSQDKKKKKKKNDEIDNAHLFANTIGRSKILNKDDFNIDDPDDNAKLRYIFKRISKMELENYDEVHDKIEPSIIQCKEIKDANMTRYSEYKSKYKKKKNKTNKSTNPKYVLYNRGEKDRYSKPYLNPTLDLQYQKEKMN